MISRDTGSEGIVECVLAHKLVMAVLLLPLRISNVWEGALRTSSTDVRQFHSAEAEVSNVIVNAQSVRGEEVMWEGNEIMVARHD